MRKSERNDLWVAAAHHSVEQLRKLRMKMTDIAIMLDEYEADEDGEMLTDSPIIKASFAVSDQFFKLMDAIENEIEKHLKKTTDRFGNRYLF